MILTSCQVGEMEYMNFYVTTNYYASFPFLFVDKSQMQMKSNYEMYIYIYTFPKTAGL